MNFHITDSAATRINILMTEDKNPNLYLRIQIQGGGCSGFQYSFDLESCEPKNDDHVFTHNGARVVIDEISLGILNESQLDYVEDMAASMFVIKNPNAESQCGCGNSFSI